MMMQNNVICGIQISVVDYSKEIHQHIKDIMLKYPLIKWIHEGRNYGIGEKLNILSFNPERLFYFDYTEEEINTPESYIVVGMLLYEGYYYSNENASTAFILPSLEKQMENDLNEAIYLICEDKPEYIFETIVDKNNKE